MSDKRLTKQEIEDKLGIQLEYYSSSHYIDDLDQTFTNSYLEEKSEQDLINVQLEALKSGDIEKAELSHSLLKDGTKYGLIYYTDEQKKELGQSHNESMRKVIEDIEALDENASATQIEELVKQGKLLISTVERVDFKDDEYTQLQETLAEKTEELQVKFLEKYTQELDNIDLENFNKEEVTEIFEKYDDICNLCNGKSTEEGKRQLRETLQKKVEEKINQLDANLKELKEHIEIPENEEKINELQTQIENLEEILVNFKAKQDFKENWKLEKVWDKYQYHNAEKGYSVSLTDGDMIEQQYRDEFRKVHNHRELRLQEQGKDMTDIMGDIADYRSNSWGAEYDFTQTDSEVTRKTQYLEKKLAILQQHKEIPENEKRISEIESQLEQMQDAWVLATSREKPIDIINRNNQSIENKRNKIAELQQKLEMVRTTEPQSVGYISNIENLILTNQRDIARLSEQNASLEQNTDKRFMGEHHKKRFEQEEKARAEEQARIKAEQEEKARAEEQARIKAEQEEKARAEEQARIKAEQEEKARAEEQARIKAEQEEKARAEEQARIKAEQEEKARAEEQARIKAEQEEKARAEEQARIKAEQEEKARAEEQARIKAEQEEKARAEEQARKEKDAEMMKAHMEYMKQYSQTPYTSDVVDQYWNEIHSQNAKVHKQPQLEKIRPSEESIRDQVGDDLQNRENQLQERRNPSVNLWMNRLNGWYSAIDRVAQNVKAKFVEMKSDIVKAISDKIKERTSPKEQNTQDQDPKMKGR